MELRFSTASNVRGLLRYNDDDDDDDASGIWVGIARAQIRQLKMDLGIDSDYDWDWDCNLQLPHGLALDCNQMWARQGDGGSSGIYSSSPCWTWELGVLFGWSQGVFGQSLNGDLLLLYLWLITHLMASRKAG